MTGRTANINYNKKDLGCRQVNAYESSTGCRLSLHALRILCWVDRTYCPRVLFLEALMPKVVRKSDLN